MRARMSLVGTNRLERVTTAYVLGLLTSHAQALSDGRWQVWRQGKYPLPCV